MNIFKVIKMEENVNEVVKASEPVSTTPDLKPKKDIYKILFFSSLVLSVLIIALLVTFIVVNLPKKVTTDNTNTTVTTTETTTDTPATVTTSVSTTTTSTTDPYAGWYTISNPDFGVTYKFPNKIVWNDKLTNVTVRSAKINFCSEEISSFTTKDPNYCKKNPTATVQVDSYFVEGDSNTLGYVILGGIPPRGYCEGLGELSTQNNGTITILGKVYTIKQDYGYNDNKKYVCRNYVEGTIPSATNSIFSDLESIIILTEGISTNVNDDRSTDMTQAQKLILESLQYIK